MLQEVLNTEISCHHVLLLDFAKTFFGDFENNLENLCVENCTFANLIMPRGCQGWLAIFV